MKQRSALVSAALVLAMGAFHSAAARATSTLPDDRGYELVSASNTNSNDVYGNLGATVLPLSDDSVIYGGGESPFGPTGSGSDYYYLATRTSSGWASSSLLPANVDANAQYLFDGATPSASAVVYSSGPVSGYFSATLPTNTEPNGLEYWTQAGSLRSIDTSPTSGGPVVFGGLSTDGDTVVFSSPVAPDGTPNPNGQEVVYAWHPDGSVQALDGLGDALADCSATPAAEADSYGVQNVQAPNPVSADGSIVFMQSGPGTGAACPANSQVFVSISGVSHEISEPLPASGISDSPSSASSAQFLGATPSGSTAYFATATPLTASAEAAAASEPGQPEIYKWDDSGGDQLMCVSCEVPDFQSDSPLLAAVSAEANDIYFSSFSSLPSGATASTLYAYDGRNLISVNSFQSTSNVGYPLDTADFAISPSGSAVVFAPNSSAQGGGPFYRVVITGDSPSPAVCVTCANGVGGATLSTAVLPEFDYSGPISNDGNTIVFSTLDPSDPSDVAAPHQVDEWTPSSGASFIGNTYADGSNTVTGAFVTPDAQDIFFFSRDPLTGDDTQPGVGALFDARIDGGFGSPPLAPTCIGDACQGAGSGGVTLVIASTGPSSGNVVPSSQTAATERSPQVLVEQPTSRVLAANIRRGRLVLTLRLGGSGRLLLRWTLREGKKVIQFVRSAANLDTKRESTYLVTATLTFNSSVRKALGTGARLSTSVDAAFAGRTSTLRLVLAQTRERKR